MYVNINTFVILCTALCIIFSFHTNVLTMNIHEFTFSVKSYSINYCSPTTHLQPTYQQTLILQGCIQNSHHTGDFTD